MAETAPPRPWWAELGAVVPRSVAFARRAAAPRTGAELPPLAANPLTWATVALDEFAIATAYLMSRTSAEAASEAAVDRTRVVADLLRDAGVADDPRRAHPDIAVPRNLRTSHRRRMGVDFVHVSFPSPYRPPIDIPELTSGGAVDETAHAYLLQRNADGPWVVMLHGHRMGEPRDLRLLGSVRIHRDLAVNVAHLVLPWHGPRGREATVAFPGIDPVENFLGMGRAVADVRTLLAWLRSRGAGRTAVCGVSLGAHVAAMVAGVDEELSCVVAGVPTSDLASMLADTVRARWGHAALARTHVLDDDAQLLSRLASPLILQPQLPVDRRFIYAAVGDRLVTPQQAVKLWHHWDRCEILWLQGGHIANNVSVSRRFVLDALRRSGVTGR